MTTAASFWSIRDGDLGIQSGALVGILNVTPDSFSDGGDYADSDVAIARGIAMVEEGAVIVDVGGESTRPGARPVAETEEMRRLLPVVEGLVEAGVRVSVDTYKPGVAGAALALGAEVINDVTGFRDEAMVEVVSGSDCGVVAMHMRGTPVDMQKDPRYDDVVGEVEEFLMQQVERLAGAGVERQRIAIDPGIGFGKSAEHNLTLLANLGRLAGHGLPLLVGTSRKRFLSELIAQDTREARDQATAVTTTLGFASGARLFRVHDVPKSRDALRIASAIVANQ